MTKIHIPVLVGLLWATVPSPLTAQAQESAPGAQRPRELSPARREALQKRRAVQEAVRAGHREVLEAQRSGDPEAVRAAQLKSMENVRKRRAEAVEAKKEAREERRESRDTRLLERRPDQAERLAERRLQIGAFRSSIARRRAWAKLSSVYEKPSDIPTEVRDEFRTHARRQARLARIRLMAAEAGDADSVHRTTALIRREDARHESRLQELTAAKEAP